MASRVEEFDEKILACAKEEFLEKGYTDASIRTIDSKCRCQYQHDIYAVFR
mgnify:CR=1 FL=1